jgi:hypothetical protein
VFDVNDEIPRGEVGERAQSRAALVGRPAPPCPPRAEQLGLGQADQPERRALEARVGAAHHDGQELGAQQRRDDRPLQLVVLEDLPQPGGGVGIAGHEPDAEPLRPVLGQAGGQPAELAAETLDRARLEAERRAAGRRPCH